MGLNLCHTMKLWEKVVDQRLRQMTKISENQFSFMPGRSTIETIVSLGQLVEIYRAKIWQLVETYRATRKKLHVVFIDEKNLATGYLNI